MSQHSRKGIISQTELKQPQKRMLFFLMEEVCYEYNSTDTELPHGSQHSRGTELHSASLQCLVH